jgi:NAD(P)-dependent dehydrogenase (short-subunit alcohol dehydrogenase family)
MKLDGKTALVTGGGRGLGREMALSFAQEGADVAVTSRTASEIENVKLEIEALGRKALAVKADLLVEEEVNSMVEATLEEFGKIDILVNNAGTAHGSQHLCLIEDFTLQDWRFVVDTNLTGTFLCSRAVLKGMIEKKRGVILNITSGMGARVRPRFGAYLASKLGIEGFTKALAAEATPHNIRANVLRPGPMATDPLLKSDKITPFKIIYRPEAIRPVAVYLVSSDSEGVTGQIIDCMAWLKEHVTPDLSQFVFLKRE